MHNFNCLVLPPSKLSGVVVSWFNTNTDYR